MARAPHPPPPFEPRIETPQDLEDALARLPDATGVYIMRDREGRVIYVGKARRLRVRVRQYFSGQDTRRFVPLLGKLVGDIETVVTANDKEALLLENNLIKRHRPRFNVRLRDDKNFLVLRLDPQARWPRLTLVRRMKQDGALYFGPYHSAASARATLRVVNRHFQLRTCTDRVLATRSRPCLQYQIRRCPAPCVLDVDEAAYQRSVRDVALFLRGRHDDLLEGLRARMADAAEDLRFEEAAVLRDQIESIETTLTAQRVVSPTGQDQDVVGMYREGGQVELVVLQIRGGKLLGSQGYSERGMELPDEDVLAHFLAAYYEYAPPEADEVLLPFALAPDDADPLARWLTERRGRGVHLRVPQRGAKRKLVSLAARNAGANFVTRRDRRKDAHAALDRLRGRLRLSRAPQRMECFDISHLQGTDVVASMVVFVDGEPARNLYRTFKIRGAAAAGSTRPAPEHAGNDDFAAMYEVLSRRLERADPAGEGDPDWALPDLLVVDGGKGQLGRAMAALQDLGVPTGPEGVEVVALAKERVREAPPQGAAPGSPDVRAQGLPGRAHQAKEASRGQARYETRPERVFVPGVKDPIVLRPGSSERHLMERLRDEAHRFAITAHRKRRSKRMTRGRLTQIAGVGVAIERKLLRRFGSVAAVARADEATLCEVPGVGPALARRILEELATPSAGRGAAGSSR